MPWEPLPGDAEREPAALDAPLQRLLRGLGAPKPGTMQSVFDAWPDLVGEQIAAHARPAGLRDGVLTVAVPDPAWATQLRFLEADLVRRIADAFGPDEVTRVEVRVRPARR